MPESVKLVKAELQEIDLAKPEAAPKKKVPVQFNPESLKVAFANQIQTPEGGGSGDQRGGAAQQFVGAGTTKLTLQLWFDVNAPQADGATALHWAAYRSDAEATAALIRSGANINRANNYGVTPLALAAQQGSPAVLDLLLKAGANPNDPVNFVNAGETPLMTAARSANLDAVKTLVRAGADVNAKETWSGPPGW